MKLKELIDAGVVKLKIGDPRVQELFDLADIVPSSELEGLNLIKPENRIPIPLESDDGTIHLITAVYRATSRDQAKKYFDTQINLLRSGAIMPTGLKYFNSEPVRALVGNKTLGSYFLKEDSKTGVVQIAGFGRGWRKNIGRPDLCWALYGHIPRGAA